jgi:molecular chaperone HtpG
MSQKGTLSINTQNIFPIIKKFLYADHEIFLRELVSNAVDATQKLKKLASMGKFDGELGDLKIKVSFDEEAKTITISDRGIGMNPEEIDKYINQIAFSGASDFVEKYKDSDAQEIIGHFGLGFYSAFMVSDTVDLTSRSCYSKDETEATLWQCDGSTEFTTSSAVKKDRGTEIVLHVAEDSMEFVNKARLNHVLTKYGKFLPVEIEFEGETINNPSPIWIKSPSELKDEDYKNFYKELYPASMEEPLFWIHLNVDYPFNLTGILYFPKIKQDFTAPKEKIQLYSRQVFITDEVKDIVPEFLTLLHGVIDSPDIPLNVSRSYLQADTSVKRINSYITKKVADKIADMFKKDRTDFEAKWDNFGFFVKFGMVTEDKFYDKADKFFLFKNVDGKTFTIEEYLKHIEGNQTDKNDTKVILYTNDVKKQHTFIQSAKKRACDVLVFDTPLASHLINRLESKLEKVSFKRIDADIIDKLIEKEQSLEVALTEEQKTSVKELFDKTISRPNWTVNIEALASDDLPVTIMLPEFMRRMKEMSALNGMDMGMMPESYNVIVNGNHPIIQKIAEGKDEAVQTTIIKQTFDLALLSQGMLEGELLTDFIERSLSFVGK